MDEPPRLSYRMIAFWAACPDVEMTVAEAARKWLAAEPTELDRHRLYRTMERLVARGWLARRKSATDGRVYVFGAGPALLDAI